VSNARISILVNRDKPSAAVAVLEQDGDTRRRQDAFARLGPFDEDDRVVEVRLEVSPLGRRDLAEAEEVEVRDVDAPVVAVTDGEGRARDRLRDAEGAARAAHERRLPRAQLARDGDDIAGLEVGRELRRELFGLFGGVGLGQNRPSWTAGSAVTGVRKTGFGGGATSRPSSSGRRAKSDFSTSSMRGVYSAAAGW
jgi:hypothetical protein